MKYIAAVAAASMFLSAFAQAQENAVCAKLDDMINVFLSEQVKPRVSEFMSSNLALPTAILGESAKECLPRNYETPFGNFIVRVGTEKFYVVGHDWYLIEKT